LANIGTFLFKRGQTVLVTGTIKATLVPGNRTQEVKLAGSWDPSEIVNITACFDDLALERLQGVLLAVVIENAGIVHHMMTVQRCRRRSEKAGQRRWRSYRGAPGFRGNGER
jgi:hypothetical protein